MAGGGNRLRLVYYTRPAFLFHSLGLIRAMCGTADVHLLLELSPEERAAGTFGEQAIVAPPGVSPAASALRGGFLAGAGPFLSGLATFDLVVHPSRRALAPSAAWVALQAARRVRQLRPDVLHFEDVAPRTAPLLYLTPGIAKLVSIHDARTHPGDPVGRAELVRRIALRRAAHALFYSRYTRDLFFAGKPHLPASVLPIPAYDVYRDWPGEDVGPEDRTILFFGRISAYKGLDVLYAALPRVAQHVPGLRVIVAGQVGRYRLPPPPVLPTGASLDTCFGLIDVPGLRHLFQAATLVVLPYVEASQSGVVPAAYAFGKPLVATAVGGLPEVIHDGATGLLVPPRDPDALAVALIQVLMQPDLRAHLQAGIRGVLDTEQGWPVVAPRLAQVYWQSVHEAGGLGR